MKKIIIMCAPPGAGKSTRALELENMGYVRVSQDDQTKSGHMKIFEQALSEGKNIVVDRLNFNKQQRDRYLNPAKALGYSTEIIVLHFPYATCLERCLARKNHPTIKEEKDARSALATFFGKYERVEDSEADVVTRLGWDEENPQAIIVDLDGTLCNIDHRLHFMRGEKKNWPGFFEGMSEDKVNQWCARLIYQMGGTASKAGPAIVLASGRPDTYKPLTKEWLEYNSIGYDNLFMRPRNDSRRDDIVKEIILGFEILPRYNPLFFIDDRQQVVDMWRKRGYTCLQCAKGDF